MSSYFVLSLIVWEEEEEDTSVIFQMILLKVVLSELVLKPSSRGVKSVCVFEGQQLKQCM